MEKTMTHYEYKIGEKVSYCATSGIWIDAEIISLNSKYSTAVLKIEGRCGTHSEKLSRIQPGPAKFNNAHH
jgi:hypothetical protein